MLYEYLFIIFITLPLGYLSRICFIKTLLKKNSVRKKSKTLLKKNSVEKKSSERKRVQHIFCVIICLVKNLTRKAQWDKTKVKGKRRYNKFISPPSKDNYIWDKESQITFYTSYSKALLNSDFVERSDLSPYSSLN